ncbi:MAG: GNAT family N-acetyltransferase [Firmicutes bacterium]|nr:GNAT family N-acetyltransferase [Bacillota bacterium]
MKEILKKDYYKVIDLVDEGIKYPEVISVIEKNNPGKIFVDNINNPKSALVWNQGMMGFYLIGDSNSKLLIKNINRFIDDYIKTFLNDRDIDYIEVSGTTKKWDKTIENIFNNRDLKGWRQLIYTFNEKKIRKQTDNFKYSIYSLKDNKLNYHKFSNWRYYENVLSEFWGGVDELVDKFNCYYAVDGNEIIGICYSAFLTSNIKTIGIETDKKYLNKGVGYNLAINCVEEVLKEGKLPWWDCMEKNIPSRKLAEKLGFIKFREYICYSFNL